MATTFPNLIDGRQLDSTDRTTDVNPSNLTDVVGEFARASFDRAVAESSKLTEQLVKLAGETVQPLSTRASLNAERINELAA